MSAVQVKIPNEVIVRRLDAREIPAAMELVWEVFQQFEAPDYSEDGINEFRRFIDDVEEIQRLKFYGAFAGKAAGELVGVIAMRQNHIGLFFVRADQHRKGIGRKLFETVCKDFTEGRGAGEGKEPQSDVIETGGNRRFTVNSSPYAVEVYKRLGFTPEDVEKATNGIRFTPMICKLER